MIWKSLEVTYYGQLKKLISECHIFFAELLPSSVRGLLSEVYRCSVVEHCISSAEVVGSIPREHTY